MTEIWCKSCNSLLYETSDDYDCYDDYLADSTFEAMTFIETHLGRHSPNQFPTKDLLELINDNGDVVGEQEEEDEKPRPRRAPDIPVPEGHR